MKSYLRVISENWGERVDRGSRSPWKLLGLCAFGTRWKSNLEWCARFAAAAVGGGRLRKRALGLQLGA